MLTGRLNEWHLTDGRNEGIDTQLFERRISLPRHTTKFLHLRVVQISPRLPPEYKTSLWHETIVLGEYNDERNWEEFVRSYSSE